MKIASVAEVRSHFSEFLKASASRPVVVTRNGRPVAVLVGVEDDEELERLLMAHSPKLKAILDHSREQIRRGEAMSHDKFWGARTEMKRPTRRRKPPKT